ncbi:MAG TPA: hypothetical protein VEA63_02850, partial [Opitutus sp.]|nr:hypothetical protein [Opitutus sp.]
QALMNALANSQVDHDNNPGTPAIAFKNYSGLKVINPYMSGGHTGIRDPNSTKLYQMSGYSRANLVAAAQVEIDSARTYFIAGASPVPSDRYVQFGFWKVTDTTASPPLWEHVADQLYSAYNGATPTAVGFFMENLAATKTAQDADPADGTPVPSYGEALLYTNDFAYTGFQALGNFARPFNPNHVYKTVNGSPGASMEYAYNTYRARYFEVYISDLQSPTFQLELKRWRDFLAALPN